MLYNSTIKNKDLGKKNRKLEDKSELALVVSSTREIFSVVLLTISAIFDWFFCFSDKV